MIVSWLTTNRCNLRCAHCYQDAGTQVEQELTTAEGKTLIEQIARAGFPMMIFSGGEPLMRDDIDQLVAHAAACGLRPVLGTNGTLITRETARQLKGAGAGTVGISLDSLREQRHNAFRGSADSYRLTMEGIAHCREAGLPFQIHTTVLDWNREELGAITDFAVSQGAVAHYLFFLIPVGRGVLLEQTALEMRAYEQTLEELMRKQQRVPIEIKPTCAPQFVRVARELGVSTRFGRGCIAGLSYCVIGPDGYVRPCAYMTEQAGNVRQRAFDEIWRHSPLFQTLRTRAYKGICSGCEDKLSCGGCRARAAYYHDGDLLAEDSYCIRSLDRGEVEG